MFFYQYILFLFIVFLKGNSCSNRIKNYNKPICAECMYYIKNKGISSLFDFGKCKKFGVKNIVTGKINYKYAEICRDYEHLCGINGNYYKKLEDQEPENNNEQKNT